MQFTLMFVTYITYSITYMQYIPINRVKNSVMPMPCIYEVPCTANAGVNAWSKILEEYTRHLYIALLISINKPRLYVPVPMYRYMNEYLEISSK